MGDMDTTLQYTYVSDIYQWIIDDVLTKIHSYFLHNDIDEGVLLELAHGWEKRILEMKILEAPNQTRYNRNQQTTLIFPEKRNYGYHMMGESFNSSHKFVKKSLDRQLVNQIRRYRDTVS